MTLRGWILWLAVAVMLAAGRHAPGQPAATADAELDPGAAIHVYLLTFGPGDDPWEKFGHNAIRIVNDAAADEYHDLVFHWGAFDFDNGFIWHFIQGKLLYHMAVGDGKATIDEYANVLHRDVQEQELNLTSAQKSSMIRALFHNYNDPALRNYRYDYYRDNCSTRVRDAIDQVIDHRLRSATQAVSSGATFRYHTDRLDASTPWLYVALQGVLGHPVDQPIDRWQEMLLPEKVHDRVNELVVEREGRQVKLAMSDQFLFKSDRPKEPARPPVVAPWYLLAGFVIGGVFAGLGHAAGRSRLGRWCFVLVALPWLFLMGVGGSLIWWGWLATDHVVARNNENVLHVSVLALPLLVMLPRLVFGKRGGAAATKGILFAMVAISLLGLLLKLLPMFYQVNWSIIAFCLPPNIALAYAAWLIGKSPILVPQEADQANVKPAKGQRPVVKNVR